MRAAGAARTISSAAISEERDGRSGRSSFAEMRRAAYDGPLAASVRFVRDSTLLPFAAMATRNDRKDMR
jgi:hypothetical protein